MLLARDPVTGSQARRAAREELSRPEYHHGGPNWLQRVGDWLSRQLAKLFGGGGGIGGNATLILLVLLVLVILFVVWRVGLPRRTSGMTVDEPDLLAPVAAREHRRKAAEYAASGQHALALREYLRAAVATIEERGVLPPRPGRTGAATAREAGPLLPEAAGALAASTAAFDEVWFGGRDATTADVGQARAAADAVASNRLAGDDTAPTTAPHGLAVPR